MSAVRHETRRLSLDIRFRRLQVLSTTLVTPRMKRITLSGPELAGFESPSPDDHVKLFFPAPDQASTEPPAPQFIDRRAVFPGGYAMSPGRDYTPRRIDLAHETLDIDFVLHGDGPASTWAANAVPGHWLGMGGPKGSRIVADDFVNYVVVGDETALPAIGRWLEGMPATAKVITLVEIADDAERQPLTSAAQVDRRWFPRDGRPAGTGDVLLDALKALRFPEGDTFVWIAAESRLVRLARHHLLDERGHDEAWLKASGYWKLEPLAA